MFWKGVRNGFLGTAEPSIITQPGCPELSVRVKASPVPWLMFWDKPYNLSEVCCSGEWDWDTASIPPKVVERFM